VQFSNVQTGESLQTVINNTLLNETEGKGDINSNPERILEGCEKVLSSWECKINLVPVQIVVFIVLLKILFN